MEASLFLFLFLISVSLAFILLLLSQGFVPWSHLCDYRTMSPYNFATRTIVLLLLGFILFSIQTIAEDSQTHQKKKEKYTSFSCIGGSQVLNSEIMKQASVKVFPLNDPEFRTCKFRNMCLVNGTLTYFQQYKEDGHVPQDYLPKGFNGKIHHLSYLRGFTMPIETRYGPIPDSYPFHSTKIMFLDANSWSFNYGHYLNDNVIPTFVASRIFNLPFVGSQQIFETNCRRFSTLGDDFTNRVVTYNRSMGTYQHACLEKLDKLYKYFYDHAPLYANLLTDKILCFDTMISGQGSTFGLKSIDLSRGYFFREFRNYVLNRIQYKPPSNPDPTDENLILVGLRTVGSAGGAIINDLCEQVKTALQQVDEIRYRSKFNVKCFVPSDLGFVEEVEMVQKAKVIISVHGTISYMSLFSRDGTIQISLAHPKELKENQMLLYATHFTTLYLTWDRINQLSGVLEHALALSEANYEQ